jgi:hypothetical protein
MSSFKLNARFYKHDKSHSVRPIEYGACSNADLRFLCKRMSCGKTCVGRFIIKIKNSLVWSNISYFSFNKLHKHSHKFKSIVCCRGTNSKLIRTLMSPK